jgi:hypothetical protein
MKKVILLLVVIVVLIVTIIAFGRRRSKNRNFAGASNVVIPDSEKLQNSQVDLILSKDETLLSYSILLKSVDKPVESVYFTVAGERIKQISGPRPQQRGADDIILHGLWRESDSKPFSAERVEQLKTGQLTVSVEFKEGSSTEISINR